MCSWLFATDRIQARALVSAKRICMQGNSVCCKAYAQSAADSAAGAVLIMCMLGEAAKVLRHERCRACNSLQKAAVSGLVMQGLVS